MLGIGYISRHGDDVGARWKQIPDLAVDLAQRTPIAGVDDQ